MKRFMSLMMVAAIMLTMTGCKASTSEAVIEKMNKNIDKESSYDADLSFDISMDVDVGSIFGDESSDDSSSAVALSVKMNGDIEMSVNKESDGKSKTRMEGNTVAEFFGMKSQTPVLGYIEENSEKAIFYSSDPETGKWIKSERTGAGSMNVLFKLIEEKKKEMTLDKNMKEIGSQECYVLSGKLTDEDIKEFISSAEGIDKSDIEDMEVGYVLYVDEKTMLPVQFVIDSSDESGELVLNVEITFDNWGTAKEVVIPKAAKNAALTENE